jgi:tetratricopeptide (TPR) repeat protein/tRNA A-37 threonylcarbamoyl transferase component Bud32/TolB-like protein
LDAGGMGVVYKARDIKLGRMVALKFLPDHLCTDRRALERLWREARLASSLNHPNICTVYEIEEWEGQPFIVMELLEGQTLRDRLVRAGLVPPQGRPQATPLPTDQLLDLAIQAAKALQAAHSKGIIHQDIKPANIFVTTHGLVKVMDFGLAKLLPRPDAHQESSTQDASTGASGGAPDDGMIAGTPAYMSPEQVRREKLDARTDLFSFGAVLYEMATGQRPFPGTTVREVWDAILNRSPIAPRRLNPALDAKLESVITKALMKLPETRHQSAAEMRADLERAGAPLLPETIGEFIRLTGEHIFRHWLVASILTAAFVLAVVLAVAMRVREEVLAVLPFVTTESGRSPRAGAEGMAEGVANRLAQFSPRPTRLFRRTVTVIPYRDVAAHRVSSTEDARRELGANRVLEGSIDRSTGRERLLLSIVDAETKRILCAGTITDLSDPVAIEERVAGYCAKCLELESVPVPPPTAVRVGPRGREAYKFYLEGRGYLTGSDIPDAVQNAIQAFSRAIEVDSQSALAYTGLGEAYWKKYETTKDTNFAGLAQQSCDQALHLNDELAEAHICLGTLHNGAGEYAEATDEFSRAIQLDSRNDDAWRGLAQAHSGLRKTKEAEQEYLKAVSVRPYWGNYVLLGDFYLYQGRYPEAESQFTQAIRQTPENSEPYFGLGGVYIAMGRYDDAVKSLRKAIAYHPTFGARENLGTAYLALGRFAEAITAYEQALKLAPNDHRAYGNLARANYWGGKRNDARPLYQQAAELAEQQLNVNPQDRNVHIDLAWYYAMLGQQPQALNHLVSAQAMQSGEAEFAFIAAIVHNQFGERASALVCLRRARELGYSTTEMLAAPELKNLRDDPEFRSVTSRTKTQ